MHQVLWLLYIATAWYNSKSFIPCYDSGWFSAVLVVPIAPEVLAGR